jgi:selenocysteine lyase/cysteine desulfurase
LTAPPLDPKVSAAKKRSTMSTPLSPELFDLGDVLWVMHCAEGPVPRASAQAAQAHLERELRPWEASMAEWVALPQRVRAQAARALGAADEDVTFSASTSGALTIVAQSFPWSQGDEVLLPLGEFPANVWPWKALEPRGVRVREVELWPGHRAGREAWESLPPTREAEPEARLLNALGERTRVLAVSWVRFQDGLRLDLSRLARGCAERRVALVVDGIQGAGTLPLDLRGLSAFATGVHKGLLAPHGLGLLWTSPSFRARLFPMGSWLSVEGGCDFGRANTDLARAWLADGRRLEASPPSPLLLAALEQSLSAVNAAGIGAIAEHVAELQRLLLVRLSSIDRWAREAERLEGLRLSGRLGSIVALHHGGRGPQELHERIKRGFARRLFATVREGYLRLALHGWHREGELDRLLDWLAVE